MTTRFSLARTLSSLLLGYGLIAPALSSPIAFHNAHWQPAMAPVQMQPVFLGRPGANGLSLEHMAITIRRHRLSSTAQMECAALDSQLPTLIRTARQAKAPEAAQAKAALEHAKQRFEQLRC